MVKKRSRGRATHQNLIDAAVRVMRADGPDQVTTTRLTEAAGIVQSGFYVHFGSVDEVLEAAALQVGAHLRETVQGWLDEVVALGGGTVAQLTRHYERVFELLLKDRHFTELFLRYRRSPSQLGAVLRRFESDIRNDVAARLSQLTAGEGAPPGEVQADAVMQLFWGFVDGLLYPSHDPRCFSEGSPGSQGSQGLPGSALLLAVLTKAAVELLNAPHLDNSSHTVLSPELLMLISEG